MSGTSMATWAASVGALMLQANPDLSPFDIRNILQETATYSNAITWVQTNLVLKIVPRTVKTMSMVMVMSTP